MTAAALHINGPFPDRTCQILRCLLHFTLKKLQGGRYHPVPVAQDGVLTATSIEDVVDFLVSGEYFFADAPLQASEMFKELLQVLN